MDHDRHPVRRVQRAAALRRAHQAARNRCRHRGRGRTVSVEGYFDQRTFLDQLGVQVTVQPANAGPLAFGTSTRFRTGSTTVPGAISVTWIDVGSKAEAEGVKERSRGNVAELAQLPGFIGWVGIGIAERLYTLTLWDDPDSIRHSGQAPSTKPLRERCSSRISALPSIPETGFPNTSIRSGCGARRVEPSSTPASPELFCACGEPSPARRSYV